MIPHDPDTSQDGTTDPAPIPHSYTSADRLWAAVPGNMPGPDDGPGTTPPRCPPCGPRFCRLASYALDAITIAREALDDAQAILEQEVRP